jgi:hypothetical protein
MVGRSGTGSIGKMEVNDKALVSLHKCMKRSRGDHREYTSEVRST